MGSTGETYRYRGPYRIMIDEIYIHFLEFFPYSDNVVFFFFFLLGVVVVVVVVEEDLICCLFVVDEEKNCCNVII